MLLQVRSFHDGSVVEEIDFDVSSLEECVVNYSFLNMHFTRMKKFHHVRSNKTKIISEISGTTAKPYKQKGTGRARQGTKRAAQHRGGATMFGPRGLTRSISLPKKEVSLAKRMLLAIALKGNGFFVVSDCSISNYKTKSTLNCLKNFAGLNFLILHDDEVTKDNIMSSRNLRGVRYANVKCFTTYDVMSSDAVLSTKKALIGLSKMWS